jgi:hypothetical protein
MRRRIIAAGLVAASHFSLQLAIYALGFAVGPEAATREVLGVSLYGIASVLTFPLVRLAERLEWSGIGVLLLPLNSAAWGASVYLALGFCAGLGRRRHEGQ